MKKIPLSKIRGGLSRFLHEARTEAIIITRHGKPAGLLIGFKSEEEDCFDSRLENDPRFLLRVRQARKSLRTGHGIPLERERPLRERIAKITRTVPRLGNRRRRIVKKSKIDKLWGHT